jgi:hypothetical protein
MTAQIIAQEVRGFFTTMVRSWQEMLIFTHISELTSMGLIIANRALTVYWYMLRFWWLVLGFLALMVYEQSYHAVPVIMLGAYGVFILLLTRSSVPLKNYAYVFASNKSIIALIMIVTIGVINLIPFHGIHFFTTILGWHKDIIILSPIIRLAVLCKLDDHISLVAGPRALVRATKMFLYHYPFFIIVYFCAWYLLYPLVAWPFVWFGALLSGSIPSAPVISQFLALMLWIPWYSATIVYGYTRFMREHMDYYY